MTYKIALSNQRAASMHGYVLISAAMMLMLSGGASATKIAPNSGAPTAAAMGTKLANSEPAHAAPADAEPANLGPSGPAYVDLRVAVSDGLDPRYEDRAAFDIPENHQIGDNLFPYEGIGWENELVGYRLYLDERAVTDVFGKKTPKVWLNRIDYRSKYHDPADWGMDVMHVGPSLGVGGLGLYRGDSLQRFGKDGRLSVEVLNRQGDTAGFMVKHVDMPVTNGVTANIQARYSLATGSPLTWVNVLSNAPDNTLASGLVMAADSKLITSKPAKPGAWRYIATWGDTRSEAQDGLGTVLFYRDGDAVLMPAVNETFPIRFAQANFRYAFAGVWEQGPMGISDEAGFIKWADATLSDLPQ